MKRSDARKRDEGKLAHLVSGAVSFAAIHHGSQTRWDGEPYINHPLRVMGMVRGWRQVPAVLHDVVEDTEATLVGVMLRFGESVAKVVDALTRREGEEYADYIERVRLNEDARVIKLIDIEDNMNGRLKVPGSLIERWEKAKERLNG